MKAHQFVMTFLTPTLTVNGAKKFNRKITMSTVIYECPVPIILQYWYPQASGFSCLPFAPLIGNPALNKIDILVGKTVFHEHTKVFAPFFTERNPKFSTL